MTLGLSARHGNGPSMAADPEAGKPSLHGTKEAGCQPIKEGVCVRGRAERITPENVLEAFLKSRRHVTERRRKKTEAEQDLYRNLSLAPPILTGISMQQLRQAQSSSVTARQTANKHYCG